MSAAAGSSRRPPWIIRTYAGFGDAASTNLRFRDNLARGQRGLSVAFDLPTQCGYDADAAMARGEVGRTGVSVSHLGDMRELFEGIDLATANTSMTINATAPWLYALYLALADERGVDRALLRGTTQNDMLKEFVARGTYVFEPEASFRLSRALILASVRHTPRWNPTNCCGYHLMESGATAEEEVGFALLGAIFLLDAVQGAMPRAAFEQAVSAISFFINSGIELVPEIAKVRAYSQLWPDLCEERYGVRPRFRAGCQVRSLTLTAQQPEVNIVRIALSCLPVLGSADARVGALQLPGFREALGLPDVGEQTLALRTQQVWMHETGIADFPDIFAGSHVIEKATAETIAAARAIIDAGLQRGYGATILDLSALLGRRMAGYIAAVESGERVLVGVNAFEEAVAVAKDAAPEEQPDAMAIGDARTAALAGWRASRDPEAWRTAREALIAAAREDGDVIEASVAFARAGGTTGEWTLALTEVFGARWSAPLGVDMAAKARDEVAPIALPGGRKLRVLLAKAGLDGHTNALRLLAMTLRDAGAEVVWLGPGHAPEAIAHAAVSEGVDAIGLSSLSGAHGWIAGAVRSALQDLGAPELPVLMGGIIPAEDHPALRAEGVVDIFGPGARSPEIVAAFVRAATAG
ncbi:MAG: cobalamin B12-binding domain-containing protein [Deltaproteobacteria bacterium]|nr:cobalamin B12-binding domain-containing protein [Deltaproteobacteria bacterium]